MKLKLGQQWAFFLNILMNPWVLITAVIIIILSTLPSTDNSILKVFTNIFLWMTSAIFGGIIAKLWMDNLEEKVILSRGKAAVRNLKLLLNNLAGFEKRINHYLNKITSEEQSKEAIIAYLEEMKERCNVLQEEVLNSIENWTDILPDANVQTQIGIITSMKGEKDALENDIQRLNKILEENQGKSDEHKKNLEKQIADKNSELSKLRKELLEKEYKVAGTIFGATASKIDITSTGLNVKTCTNCKTIYYPFITALDNGKCDKCNSGFIGLGGITG